MLLWVLNLGFAGTTEAAGGQGGGDAIVVPVRLNRAARTRFITGPHTYLLALLGIF